jgi:hypothetical protein
MGDYVAYTILVSFSVEGWILDILLGDLWYVNC